MIVIGILLCACIALAVGLLVLAYVVKGINDALNEMIVERQEILDWQVQVDTLIKMFLNDELVEAEDYEEDGNKETEQGTTGTAS